MKKITMLLTVLFTSLAFAGIGGFQDSTNLGQFAYVKCSTGLTCSKVGDKMQMAANQGADLSLTGNLSVGGYSTLTGGVSGALVSGLKNFGGFKPDVLTSGTTTKGASDTIMLSQIYIPVNATLTGIKVLNSATVGTNSWNVALYNAVGVPLAWSALTGTVTSGASVYQAIPFSSAYAVKGPGVYWIGAALNGNTDTFKAVPAGPEGFGLVGSVASQTFGSTMSGVTLTLPTSFTANSGIISFTY